MSENKPLHRVIGLESDSRVKTAESPISAQASQAFRSIVDQRGEARRLLGWKKPAWIAKRMREVDQFDSSPAGFVRSNDREARRSERETLKRDVKRSFKQWRRLHPDGDPNGEPALWLDLPSGHWLIYRAEDDRRGFVLERNGAYFYGPDTVKRCREKAIRFAYEYHKIGQPEAPRGLSW